MYFTERMVGVVKQIIRKCSLAKQDPASCYSRRHFIVNINNLHGLVLHCFLTS